MKHSFGQTWFSQPMFLQFPHPVLKMHFYFLFLVPALLNWQFTLSDKLQVLSFTSYLFSKLIHVHSIKVDHKICFAKDLDLNSDILMHTKSGL